MRSTSILRCRIRSACSRPFRKAGTATSAAHARTTDVPTPQAGSALPRRVKPDLIARLRIVVVESVQATRHFGDVAVAPIEPDIGLPPADLRFEARPIGHEPLVAPVHLTRMTRHAMR